MIKFLPKAKFDDFISLLKKNYTIVAPVVKNNDYAWQEISGNIKPEFSENSTILPPKKIFFPQIHTLFNFCQNKITHSVRSQKPFAIFGLPAADINALNILDHIFSHHTKDSYWEKQRENSILIGYGSKKNLTGKFDLFFEKYRGGFLVIAGSNTGKIITDKKIFIDSGLKLKSGNFIADPLFADQNKLARAIETSYEENADIWDKLAKTCFGCGICAYVCPLCYCFDIQDSVNMPCCNNCKSCSGSRKRKWDACFLPHFARIAGGHNFRENLKERIYNWYHHKFVRFPRELGTIGCVSCSRCIKYCPAKINYREVLEEILTNYS